ncbi:MAG: transporter [Rickettsiales bacterium]
MMNKLYINACHPAFAQGSGVATSDGIFSSRPRNKCGVTVMLASAITLFLSSNAYALNVYSPYVEEGMLEIESKNRFDFDDRASEDNFRQHKLAVEYGFTSQWKAALYGELEKENGSGYKYTATEIENIFQFTEVGEYWADVGALVAYEFKHPNGDADKFEAFLLLAKNFNKFTTMANIGFEQEVGSNSNSNPEGEIKWMAKYNYLPILSPGVEYYGEFGEITNSDDYDSQKHRLGPVMYGKFGHGFKYEAGVLFGISDAAEDYAVKLNLEYEFPVSW